MHVDVKLDLVAEAALPLVRDGATGAAKAWALTDLANALLGTGIDWSPRDNAGLMLLAGAEVETWLRLYEDDQRALREYLEEAWPGCAPRRRPAWLSRRSCPCPAQRPWRTPQSAPRWRDAASRRVRSSPPRRPAETG
jgi:hypothetical protein